MAAPVRYLSGRQQQQKIGIEGITQDEKVLEVVGRVGIGTTIFEPSKQLDVRGDVIVSGELTVGDSTFGTDTSTRNLSVSGVSTFTGAIDANGDLDVDGHTELDDVNVSGVSTFTGAADFNGDIDVDGHTELDDVNVSGASTFTGAADFNGDVDIDGHTELDDVNVSGASTFTGAADFNGDIDVDGHTELDDLNVSGVTTTSGLLDINAGGQANTFKVEDLTDNRVVIAGTGGELEDDANLTFNGTQLAVGVDLDVDGHTELDDVNVSGASTFTGAADFNGDIDVDGHTELDNLNVSGVSTFAGAADFNGDVDVDGHTELDDVNISGILTAAALNVTGGGAGSQTNLANLNVSGVSTFTGAIDANGDLDVDGHTELDSINVSAASTFGGLVDINAGGQANTFKVEDLTDNRVVIAGTGGELEDDANLTFNGTQLSVGVDLDVDGHTELDDVNVSGVSTFAGAIDANGSLDVDGHTELDNLNVSGVSTFQGNIDVISTDGGSAAAPELKLYRNSASPADADYLGQIKFAGESDTGVERNYAKITGKIDDASNTSEDGILEFAFIKAGSQNINARFKSTELMLLNGTDFSVAGDSTFTGAIDANGSLDVDGHTELDDVNVSGAITATTFSGDLTGNAGTATSLATARNFEITGDIVASAISFDGTGNVSLAATIQPNSVGLGTDTTGDYVESVSGTANEIVVTGGTGEGSTPTISFATNPTIGGNVTVGQDLTVTRDLQVTRNLNVDGNVTIGGTSATIFAETLRVTDPDLILGFRTDGSGNDISNDTTASHGGVAVASTEGTPIVSLIGVGETLPITYKKIMWFKTNAFTGLNTDAWLTNYSFGVGTTSMSAGTKFAVGNIEANFDDITAVRHINSTGVVTATSFVGSVEVPAGGSVSGTATSAINLIGGDTGDIPYQSATNTTTFLDASSAATGQVLLWSGSAPSWGYVSAASGNFGGSTVQDEGSIVGTGGSIAIFNFVGNNIQATATTGGSGIATITVSDTPTFSSLKVTGISTIPSITGPTTFTGGDVNVGTAITMDPSSGIVSATAFYGSGQNLTDLINQRIEGLQIFDDGVQVGSGFTFSSLDFVGDGVTATGIGSTATITIPGFTSDADENLIAGTCAGGTYDPSSGTACFNIFLGSCAGKCITEGDYNVFLGDRAGCSNTTGGRNFFVGGSAGIANTTGQNNTFFGGFAGQANLSGSDNFFVGYIAGRCNTVGNYNTFLGAQAGTNNTTGSYNNFIGQVAGMGNTTGSYNTMIGMGAGRCATVTGTDNTFFGRYAGKCASGSGCRNTFLGYFAGCVNTTGDRNNFIGVFAGCKNTTGDNNNFIGRYAGIGNTTGSNNNMIGDGAGRCAAVTGENNVFLGSCTGKCASGSGGSNNSIGYEAGYCNTTGSNNNFIGMRAGCDNTTGGNNNFIGRVAGAANTTGSCNNMIGYGAGSDATITGSHNNILGTFAGKDASGSGAHNFLVGYYAGSTITTGSNNINIGCESGRCSTTGDNNTFIGRQTGKCTTTGTSNVFLGNNVGFANTTGTKNIYIGSGIADNAVSSCANANIIIGQNSAKCISGNCNIILGCCTTGGGATFTGDHNFIAGYCAGKLQTTGDNNLIIGQNAGLTNTGSSNVMLGTSAGNGNTGDNNFFAGPNAGRNNTADYGVFLGSMAGRCNTSGTGNIFIGCESGCGSNNKTGSHNTSLGRSTGANLSSGSHNVFLGNEAGKCVTSGCCNIFLGYQSAGNSVSKTGSNNIMLGANTGKCQSSGSNNAFLGAGAGRYTRGSYNIGIGDCAGQGSEPSSDGGCNVSIGKLAGSQLRDGADNVFLGRCAGYNNYNGNDRIAIGLNAGYQHTGGGCTIYIGRSAGCYSQGTYNIAIGCGAGQGYSASSEGSRNIAIGLLSGCNVQGGCDNIFLGTYAAKTSGTIFGCNNLILGCCAGTSLSSGNDNIFLGRQAGNTNTSGDCNIAIGYDVELPSATGDNQMAIGSGTNRWIAGDSSFNVTIANKLLVNASGIVTASSGIVTYYGDGSNLTNLPASGVVPTENTTNQAQFIPFFTGTASTSIAGVSTTKFVFNPSTTRLGIGLTDPDATLEINVGTAVTALEVQGSAGQLFSVTNNLTSGSIFSVNDVSGIPSIDVDADGTIQLAPFSTTEFVGVGTTNPTTKLHVVGEVTATDFNSTSDARLKTNVQVIDDPLEKVLQINGVSFNWVENNKPSMGVIADNIEEVLPELVSGTNPKTVNYNGLIGLLIEVVKDQQTQINSLNERLSQLE